jgi:hypothetical protein
MIYSYALKDTNPDTIGGNTIAMPARKARFDGSGLFWVEYVAWPEVNKKPWINTGLLRVSKSVYKEARDILYNNRQFEAKAVLDSRFKYILKQAPMFHFWQHMRHFHLVLRPSDHRQQWRRHVQHGIETLMALMRGGLNLKSFHLTWEIEQYPDRIEQFRDMRLNLMKCAVVVTQVFDDPSVEVGQQKEPEREGRLQLLMLRMQGLRGQCSLMSRCAMAS